jgi:hypothetical protein
MALSGESSHCLYNEPVSPLQLATHVRDDEEEVPPRQLVSSFPFFFLKNADTSLSRMRLFWYIAVFVDDVRDDERTIWRHARWGRGGSQREAHAH